MRIRNKDIIACFPLLASVLGARYGVEVRIQGDKAMTDGRMIYLPAMPIELDADTLETAKAFIDHESAHIRFTDFDRLKSENLPKVENWLFNAIEDWRVEKKLGQIYPGCELNLHKLILSMFGEKTETGNKNPVSVILNYVLLTVRSWSVKELAVNRDETGQIVNGHFPGLKNKIDQILSKVQTDCETSEDAINYARELAKRIRKSVPDKTGKKVQAQNDQGNNNESSNTKTPQGEREEPLQESSELNSGASPNKQKSGKEANENLDNAHDLSSEVDRLMEETQNFPQNLGDLLKEKLNAVPKTEGKPGIEIASVGHKDTAPFPVMEKQEALRESAALRFRLAGLLQADTFARTAIGRHGKIMPAKLSRICVGKPQIFAREEKISGLDTALHILLDCSASMYGENIRIALKACYAIYKCLSEYKGINLALTAFPAEDRVCGVYQALRHGERVRDMPNLGAFGDTPLGEALWWVIGNMLPLAEKRKIIFVITDGAPNSFKSASLAISQCKKMDMEIYGLGIQSQAIDYLLPDSSRVIQDIGQLAPALFALLKDALLKGVGR